MLSWLPAQVVGAVVGIVVVGVLVLVARWVADRATEGLGEALDAWAEETARFRTWRERRMRGECIHCGRPLDTDGGQIGRCPSQACRDEQDRKWEQRKREWDHATPD